MNDGERPMLIGKPKPSQTKRVAVGDLLNIFSIAAFALVLVLLVIFFVATPIHWHRRVDRPDNGRTVSEIQLNERDLYLVIGADSRIRIGPMYVKSDRLLPELREIVDRTPRRTLILEADRHASYQSVETAIRAARDAGFTEIRILTGPHDVLEALQKYNEEKAKQ